MLRYIFRPNARDKEIKRLKDRLAEIIAEENKFIDSSDMSRYMKLDTERVRIELKLGKIRR